MSDEMNSLNSSDDNSDIKGESTYNSSHDEHLIETKLDQNSSVELSKKRPEDELPLSFASFYYSLKVLKGKGETNIIIL